MTESILSSQVTALRPLTPGSVELVLTPDSPFSFAAGQYVELAFPQQPEEQEQPFWPMALASAPHENTLSFCIRQRKGGALAPYFATLKPGDPVRLRGPFGTFGFQTGPAREVGFIVTGTGIAPIRSILRSQAYTALNPPTTMLFGAETPEDLPYQKELASIESLQLVPVLSHADESWQGARGWVTDQLDAPARPFAWQNTDFYLCGQPAMQEAVTAALLAKGVPPEAIFAA